MWPAGCLQLQPALSRGCYEERPNYFDFDIDVFGALGQHVAHHTHKGERVAVDGQLQWREWKNSFQEHREAHDAGVLDVGVLV